MELFFIHLLKSSSILLLFLLSYYLFLRKETFFNSNRIFLIVGILISLTLPFVTFSKTIYVASSAITTANFIPSSTITTNGNSVTTEPLFDWSLLLIVIYLAGVVFFTLRLLYQLSIIRRIKKESSICKEDNFYHVKTKKQISPFSFFKHIFYFPKQFEGEELLTIIEHEKVHARELHSIDILLTEILFIILWFNPIIWFYRIILKQNLEFLADAKTCALNQNKQNYQYLMLKQALRNHNISIANPFYNSIIKKRIAMLNQNQSRSVNRLKFLLVLPFLGLFLFGFNTKEVVKFSEVPTSQIFENEQTPTFVSPLKQEDIERVTFGFGKTNTATGVKFHNGIDLVSQAGKDVMASADGTVKIAAESEENGNYIVITHNDDYSTKYLHLKDKKVTEGEKVKSGKTIGHVGNTGKSNGPHLHFEILKSNKSLNPTSFIPFKKSNTKVHTENNSLPNKKSYSKTIKTNEKEAKTTQSPKNLYKKDDLVISQDLKVELIIDKDTPNESLSKNATFFKKRGVTIAFKNIKRNSSNEITAIKINYDNNEGDKGNYQQKKSSPIDPIVITLKQKENGTSDITVGQALETKTITEVLSSNKEPNTWVTKDGKHKTITIKKDGDSKMIFLNGKAISKEELEEEGDLEKWFAKSIDALEINDSLTGKTTIDKIEIKDKDGAERKIIRLNGDSENEIDYVIIKSDKKSKYKKIITDSNDVEIKEDENVFVINTDEAGDYNNSLKFVSKDSKPMFIVNGEEVKKLKNINPDEIESINVLKGKAAIKKYGKKGKNGVVEIIKKEKN